MPSKESATVLMISAWGEDAETDYVTEELVAREVRVLRFDIAEFPQQLQIAAKPGWRWSGHLRIRGAEVRLESVIGVFCGTRRASRGQKAWATMSASSLPPRRVWVWVGCSRACRRGGSITPAGPPMPSTSRCSFRPRRTGLTTPPTLLTNDAQAVRAFATEIDGPVVYKPLVSRALIEQDQLRVIYTSIIDPADLDDLAWE